MSELPEGVSGQDLTQALAESGEEIAAWWTPERRLAAKPVEYEMPSEAAETQASGGRGPAPGSGLLDTLQLVLGEPASSGPVVDSPAEAEQVDVGAPPVAISRAAIDFPPYAKIGQLFFNRAGQSWTGGAFVIGLNTVMTAAHNLWQAGAWSSSVLFVPAAWDGTGAFGSWSAQSMIIPPGYMPNQPSGLDYALLPMHLGGNNPDGPRSIGTTVGTLGYQTGGDPANLSWADVGYPGNFGNADRMYSQVGNFTARLDADLVVAMTGDFTQGASGGPWLLQQGAGTTVYGLHSGRRPDRPGEVLSPYFSAAMREFIKRNSLTGAQPRSPSAAELIG